MYSSNSALADHHSFQSVLEDFLIDVSSISRQKPLADPYAELATIFDHTLADAVINAPGIEPYIAAPWLEASTGLTSPVATRSIACAAKPSASPVIPATTDSISDAIDAASSTISSTTAAGISKVQKIPMTPTIAPIKTRARMPLSTEEVEVGMKSLRTAYPSKEFDRTAFSSADYRARISLSDL